MFRYPLIEGCCPRVAWRSLTRSSWFYVIDLRSIFSFLWLVLSLNWGQKREVGSQWPCPDHMSTLLHLMVCVASWIACCRGCGVVSWAASNESQSPTVYVIWPLSLYFQWTIEIDKYKQWSSSLLVLLFYPSSTWISHSLGI